MRQRPGAGSAPSGVPGPKHRQRTGWPPVLPSRSIEEPSIVVRSSSSVLSCGAASPAGADRPSRRREMSMPALVTDSGTKPAPPSQVRIVAGVK